MSIQKLIIATASGILAGAVVALLVAPATGSETREKIAEATTRVKKKVLRMMGRAANELDELHEIIQDQSTGLTEDVKLRVLKLIASTKASYNTVAS